MQEGLRRQARYSRDDMILEQLRDLKAEIREVRQEIKEVRQEIKEVRQEMHSIIKHSQILVVSVVGVALGVLYFVAAH